MCHSCGSGLWKTVLVMEHILTIYRLRRQCLEHFFVWLPRYIVMRFSTTVTWNLIAHRNTKLHTRKRANHISFDNWYRNKMSTISSWTKSFSLLRHLYYENLYFVRSLNFSAFVHARIWGNIFKNQTHTEIKIAVQT